MTSCDFSWTTVSLADLLLLRGISTFAASVASSLPPLLKPELPAEESFSKFSEPPPSSTVSATPLALDLEDVRSSPDLEDLDESSDDDSCHGSTSTVGAATVSLLFASASAILDELPPTATVPLRTRALFGFEVLSAAVSLPRQLSWSCPEDDAPLLPRSEWPSLSRKGCCSCLSGDDTFPRLDKLCDEAAGLAAPLLRKLC